MMASVGITVDLFSGPLVALEKVKLEKYDAIFLDAMLLDVIMPVMTWITFAHNIRGGGTVHKNTSIIVVTADMSTDTRQLMA